MAKKKKKTGSRSILAQLSEFNRLRDELTTIVAQANVERGAQLLEQARQEYPALTNILQDFVFKSPKEACQTITLFTGIKFDEKGIAFVERLQVELKRKRFPQHHAGPRQHHER